MVNKISTKPSVKMLREIRLMAAFSDQELADLISLGTGASYEPHSNVVIEGELSWGLYLILEGNVSILKTNKLTGENYDVGLLRQGNFFGEMSLVDEEPRSATVRTLSDCSLFYISKETFNDFLERSPALKLRFFESCVKLLVHRQRELGDNYIISQYQLWKTALKKEAA